MTHFSGGDKRVECLGSERKEHGNRRWLGAPPPIVAFSYSHVCALSCLHVAPSFFILPTGRHFEGRQCHVGEVERGQFQDVQSEGKWARVLGLLWCIHRALEVVVLMGHFSDACQLRYTGVSPILSLSGDSGSHFGGSPCHTRTDTCEGDCDD